MIEHEQFSEFSESHLLPFMFLWPCSLAVPVLAGLVYAFCGKRTFVLYSVFLLFE